MEQSRLGKLLNLLDAKNTIIRRQAAQQIGDVARLHPLQLNSLLSSLRRYIKCPSNWDARVAAALALKEVCRNILSTENTVAATMVKIEDSDLSGDSGRLNYDLQAIMASDFRLLGSEGTEFDVDVADGCGKNSSSRQNEKLRVAKHLGFLIPAISNVGDIVTDDDLNYGDSNDGQAATEDLPTPAKLFKLEPVDPDTPSSTCETAPKQVLTNFLLSLCGDLYDPNWTSRHGAALALKEAASCPQIRGLLDLIAPGQSSGKVSLSSTYILRHVFNVLAVDRFKDFVGDQVVAPVRETCAQLIATLLGLRGPNSSHDQSTTYGDNLLRDILTVCGGFLTFSRDSNQWECRHAGLLTIKYISGAVQVTDLLGSGCQDQLCAIFDAAVDTLGDLNDDVVIAAAQALLPLMNILKKISPSKIPDAIDRCWDLLSKHVPVVPELDAVLQPNSLVSNGSTHVNDGTAYEGDSAADGLFQLLESSLEPLLITDDRLRLLLPFFSHAQSNTRQRLSAVLTRSADNGTLVLSDIGWSVIAVRTFIGCIIDGHCKTTDLLASELWPAVLKLKSPTTIWSVCRPMLGQWLACLMVPDLIPLNSLVCGSPGVQFCASEVIYLGGRDVTTCSDQDRDQTVVSARLRGARALAGICSVIVNADPDPNSDPKQCLTQLMSLHMTSNSALQRQAVCMVMCEWSKLSSKECENDGTRICSGDMKSILESLLLLTSSSQSIPPTPTVYDEVLLNASEIHAACREFLDVANVDGGEVHQISPAAIILNSQEVEETCARAVDANHSTVSQTELSNRFEQLKQSMRRNASQMDRINIRVQSWLASAYVRLGGVPSKFNPIVQPLMNCVKNECNQLLVTEAAQCLSVLLEVSPPAASSKVIKNLSVLHSSDPRMTPSLASMNGKTTSESGEKILSWEMKYGREASQTAEVEPAIQSMTGRNAGLALKSIVIHFGEKLSQHFPNFFNVLTTGMNGLESIDQNLVNSMQILETVFPSLPPGIRGGVRESQITAMCSNLNHNSAVVRHMSSRCLTVMAETDLASTLNTILPPCLALLSSSTTSVEANDETAVKEEYGQLGAIELLYTLVEKLHANLIGIIPLLAVPVLTAMSSSRGEIRCVASYTFGQLVKLMPLERDDFALPGISAELISLRRQRLEFLHLLNRPDELGRHLSDGDVKSKQILDSISVNGELRSYQRDGILWLRFLAEYGLHGILCDDMGLGKTVQTLAALASVMSAPLVTNKASLIVCPKTLTSHWMNEIKKFFSGGQSSEKDNAVVLKATCVVDRVTPIDFSSFNIIIASYDLFRKESASNSVVDSILTYRWNYCILDEGHVIRNSKTRLFRTLTQLKSAHRLILSGTPVQNSVLELWALFEFLMPGYLGTQAQFQTRFGKPILLSRDAKASSVEAEAGQLALDNLHKLVLPFVLRRRKCDVLDDLPPKIIQDSPCMLSSLQSQLYEDFSRTVKEKFSAPDWQEDKESGGASSSGGNRAVGAFRVLLYLRKLCDHPCLILDEKHPNHQQVITRLAGGEFGGDCQQLNDFRLSGKMVALKQLLSECGIGRVSEMEEEDEVHATVSPHRALIFCQFKAVIALIAQYFDTGVFGQAITYRRLDGDVPPARRQAIVDQFNDDPSIDVLLLSTQIGGLGLNLTGADIVIFVDHDWNPANDLQAMDRAHRIGQKRTVNVYRLITTGTLEEKIMRLQQFKTRTADSLIGDENRSLLSMATNQLLDLLTLEGTGQPGRNGEGTSGETKHKKYDRKKSREVRGESEASHSSIELPSLWDQSQYDEAFDYGAFLNSLSN